MIRKGLGVLAIAAFAVTPAGADEPAANQAKLNKKLQGAYRIIASESCVSSPSGFGPPPQVAALGPTTTVTISVEATAVYNGDGTFTVEGRSQDVVHSSPTAVTPSYPTTKADFTCTGTYQVNPGKSFTNTYGCTGVLASGEVPGTAFTMSGVKGTGNIL